MDDYCALRDFLAEESAKLPNVTLHDFQADWNIVCNLELYKDITHYSPAINSKMLEGMKSGKYISTPEQVRAATRGLRAKLEEYHPAFLALHGNKPSRKK